MTTRTPPPAGLPEGLVPPTRDLSDRGLLWSALAMAALLHLGALCLPLPRAAAVEVPESPRGPTVELHDYEIPPPSVPEPEPRPPTPVVRRIPVPTPQATFAEPLLEAERAEAPSIILGDPPLWEAARPARPPVSRGPLDEGTPGVERPVPLPGRAQPVYPRAGRQVGLDGTVFLRAVITERGDVDSIELVRESPPGLGFGAAAVEAVSTWRYRPGRLDGRPVAVVLTVVVEFKLR